MLLDNIEKMFDNPNVLPWGLKICLEYIVAFFVLKVVIKAVLIRKIDDDNNLYEINNKLEKMYANCFEIITSSFCILFVSLLYQDILTLLSFIGNWSTVVLLCLILIGVFANNILDKFFKIDVMFKDIKVDGLKRSDIRLVSSVGLLIVMIFLNKAGSNSSIVLLYGGIVFGRFIFFDLSMEQIKKMSVLS